jgi:hypothetical protein
MLRISAEPIYCEVLSYESSATVTLAIIASQAVSIVAVMLAMAALVARRCSRSMMATCGKSRLANAIVQECALIW